MRPLRELVRHTLVYGFGSVGASLISFILIPVYTRYLTPVDYGVLSLFLLAQAVLSRFYDLGLTNAVGRFFFDYRGGESARGLGEMISTTALFLLAYGSVLSLLLSAAAPAIADFLVGQPALAGLVRMLTVTLLFEALAIPALTLIRMEERSGLWVTISVLRVAASLVLNVYFVVYAGMGVRGVILSYALVSAAVFAITAIPLARRAVPAFRLDVLGRMLAFGLPFLPVLLGVLVIDLSDRYFLQRFRSTEEVGIYSIGYKFGQVTMIAVSAFSLGWAPLRYRIFERPDAKEVYVRILNLFASATAFGVVAMSTFGDEIVRLATTPAYFESARVIPLVCAAYALYGIHLIVATGMGVMKKTLGLSAAVVVAALANLVANLLLIPRYGMMGAAASTVFAYVLLVIATDWSSQRVYRIEYEWAKMLQIALAATAIIVTDRLLQPPSLIAGLALAVVLLACFVALLGLIGGVRSSDVRAVRHWMSELRGERPVG